MNIDPIANSEIGSSVRTKLNAAIDRTNRTFFTQTIDTTLVNGVNTAVDVVGFYTKFKSGPTGNFTIAGIDGGVDGAMRIFQNGTAHQMTVGYEAVAETNQANRILTPTQANINCSVFCVLYDADLARWLVVWYFTTGLP